MKRARIVSRPPVSRKATAASAAVTKTGVAARLDGQFPVIGPAMTFDRAWSAKPRARRRDTRGLPTATKLAGISMAFQERWSETQGRHVYYPNLRLTTSRTDMETGATEKLILTRAICEGPCVWRTLREAWFELTTELAVFRGFHVTPPSWKRRCPTPADFEALADAMEAWGCRFATEMLEPVYRRY